MGRGAGNVIFQSLGSPMEILQPWRTELGPEGSFSFWKYFLTDEYEAAKLRWAGKCAQNDGCAQRMGAHARPKPTSGYIFNDDVTFYTPPRINPSWCRYSPYRQSTCRQRTSLLAVVRMGTHTLAGEGVWGPNSNEGTDTVVL